MPKDLINDESIICEIKSSYIINKLVDKHVILYEKDKPIYIKLPDRFCNYNITYYLRALVLHYYNLILPRIYYKIIEKIYAVINDDPDNKEQFILTAFIEFKDYDKNETIFHDFKLDNEISDLLISTIFNNLTSIHILESDNAKISNVCKINDLFIPKLKELSKQLDGYNCRLSGIGSKEWWLDDNNYNDYYSIKYSINEVKKSIDKCINNILDKDKSLKSRGDTIEK